MVNKPSLPNACTGLRADKQALPFDVLHLGFPKTASTYLQTVALAEHPEIRFSWRAHKGLFFELRDYAFDFDKETFLDRLRAVPIQSEKTGGKVSLFSAEGLSGNAFNGFGARQQIDLLAELMPGVKAFVVLREQKSYVASVWNAYVMEGGVLSLKGFLREHASPGVSFNIPRGTSMRTGYLNIYEKLCYDQYVIYCRTAFGHKNFAVFFFEDLKKDAPRFFREVFSFIGVDPGFLPRSSRSNVSFKPPWRSFFRQFCRFCQTQHNEAGFLPYSTYLQARRVTRALSYRFPAPRDQTVSRVNPYLPDWARQKWIVSNRHLSKMTGRDLSVLGYEV